MTDVPIRALLKTQRAGGFVLLTVNLDNAPLKATFRFKKPLRRVQVLFENRDPEPATDPAREIVEEFEPFAVHVFRLEFGE